MLRTVRIGGLWADYAASLENGLFAASYVGADAVSDSQACLLLPPETPHLIADTQAFVFVPRFSPLNFLIEPETADPWVPWMLEGAFLTAVLSALIAGPPAYRRQWGRGFILGGSGQS